MASNWVFDARLAPSCMPRDAEPRSAPILHGRRSRDRSAPHEALAPTHDDVDTFSGFTAYNVDMKGVLAGALLMLACAGGANDGWWAATGAAEGFGKHEHVQMVSESILIKLNKRSASVEVDFVFKNHGPTTTVTMGFPEKHSGPITGALENFRSWVDGKEVTVRRKVLEADDEERVWSAVWLKEVAFVEGQVCRVRVTYDADYSGNTMGHGSLTYILRTGATWRGPIETCRIIVDWSEWEYGPPDLLFTDRDRAREGAWMRTERRGREISLEEIVPDFDLSIEFVPAFWNFTVNGERVSTTAFLDLIGSPQDPLIPVDALTTYGGFFGAYDEEGSWNWWTHPVVEKLGGEFDMVGRTLQFGDGRTRQLAREPVRKEFERWHKEMDYVYLKDVVEALGGKYRYDPDLEEVAITFDEPEKILDAATLPKEATEDPQSRVRIVLFALLGAAVLTVLLRLTRRFG